MKITDTIEEENSGKGGRQTRIKRGREWVERREVKRKGEMERENGGGEGGKRAKELT